MDAFLKLLGLQRIRAGVTDAPAGLPAIPEAGETATRSPVPDTPARPPQKARPPRRPLLVRLFAISPWGALKLLALCVLVGLFVLAAQFDPRSPSFDAAGAATSLARDAWAALSWMVQNFWKPALAGAGVVLPLWVLWRLISLPFRR